MFLDFVNLKTDIIAPGRDSAFLRGGDVRRLA